MINAVLSPAILGAVIGGTIAILGISFIVIKFLVRKK